MTSMVLGNPLGKFLQAALDQTVRVIRSAELTTKPRGTGPLTAAGRLSSPRCNMT